MNRRFRLSFFLFLATNLSSLLAASPVRVPVVFTRIANESDSRSDWNRSFDRARLVVLEPDGRTRVLTQEFAAASDPEVSFDGTKVLFAGKRNPSDSWDIFEIQLDGSGLKQITDLDANTRRPIYQSTFYTIVSNEPWYQMTFVSDLAGELADADGTPATALYSSRLDGTELRRLTFAPGIVADPIMMADGRLLFTGEQSSLLRLDPLGRMALFTINTDGADLAAFSTDEGKRFKRMPALTANRLCVFVESDRPTADRSGTLGLVSLRRNLKSYKAIATPPGTVFHSPAAGPDGKILVSSRDSGGGNFRLVLLDPLTGEIGPVFAEPGQHLIQAQMVTSRMEPDGRSSVVNEGHPNGQFYGLNVAISELDREQWESSKPRRLRVLEGVAYGSDTEPASNADVKVVHRRLLGEIPIESDGSFFIEVPANVPVQLQLLDDDGVAIRSCSWIWVRNKEPRGCIGCHEDGELTPENRLVSAVQKPPIKLTLSPERRRTVEFERDIVPIIAEKCASANCHASGTHTPDLARAGQTDEAYTQSLYRVLMDPVASHEEGLIGRYVNRGEARTSPLIWHLLGRNTSRPWDSAAQTNRPVHLLEDGVLTPSERRTFIEWIDFGAHFRGLPPKTALDAEGENSGGNR